MNKIIQKIFSFKNSPDKGHKIFTFFGIKIKFKKNNDSHIVNRLNNIENLLRTVIVPSNLPQVQGRLRIQQVASLALFKNVVQFLNSNNIEYWLEFGTLLGAVRHKGFIPWDDDIDIAVRREDYEKLKTILPKFCSGDCNYSEGEIIRIYYKETSAQVDIFPFDSGYSEELPPKDKYNKIINNIKIQYRNAPINWGNIKLRLSTLPSEYKAKISTINQKEILMNKPSIEKGFMYLAYHCFAYKRVLCEYKDIFPLKEIVFEGEVFKCPNNVDKHLYEYWGDYMQLPKNCSSVHAPFIEERFTYENIHAMRELIENTGFSDKL